MGPAWACAPAPELAREVCAAEAALASAGLDVGLLLARLAAEPTSARLRYAAAGPVADGDRLLRLRGLQRRVPLLAPLDHHYVASLFGVRPDPWTGRPALHEGVDLAGLAGAPVVAPAPGRVVAVGWDDSMGRLVEIDHGLGLRTLYAHLESVSVGNRPGGCLSPAPRHAGLDRAVEWPPSALRGAAQRPPARSGKAVRGGAPPGRRLDRPIR